MKRIASVFIVVVSLCTASGAFAQTSLVQQGKTQLKNKQYQTAFSTFKKAAAGGSAEAMYYCGLCYENGFGTQRDIYEAMEWYLKSADKGNGEACFRMAEAYRDDCVVNQSHTKSVEYAKRSALAGCAAGEEMYAALLATGDDIVAKDINKALHYYQSSAAKGYEDACCDLAQIYYFGYFGVPVDKTKSSQYLAKLKARNTARGYFQLAYMYKDGSAGIKSDRDAFNYFVKAAEMGCGAAADELAGCYRWGSMSLQRSEENAIYWYKKAFEDGFTLSAVRLSFIYEDRGQCYEAFDWAYKSGDGWTVRSRVNNCRNRLSQGDMLAKLKYMANKDVIMAQYLLGKMYENGDGVSKSSGDAYDWFYKATKNRDADVFEVGDLFNSLGFIYIARGSGLETEAFKLFKKGAECQSENAMAMSNLAYCYLSGLGVAVDNNAGFSWALKAAQQNVVPAMNYLAECYLSGRGTRQDNYKAYEWAKKSADAGNDIGLFSLGMCYLRGIGVSQNASMARQYLTKSSNLGNKAAQQILNQMNGQQTSYGNNPATPNVSASNAANRLYQSMMDGSLLNSLQFDFSNIDFNNLPPAADGGSYQPVDNYNSSSSSSTGIPSRKTCPDCYGKRYRPESYTNCAISSSYQNSAGSTCPVCGFNHKHCHYPCATCQSRGTVESY